ncbi:MAG: endonuclease [Pseudonocardiales bacterium]|nr:endonuclease [Jatrophihabitantaceae bacterium]MCW2603672.1 endonuclease [Pseudonocardiales bacterium]
MRSTLVLNATYEPLGVVPMTRAVVLVLAERAVMVEEGEGVLHSERLAIALPSVVRLTRFVRVPYRKVVPLTRRGVFLRDGDRCAYCDGRAETLDHVVPRSRGGRHEWDNVVAACRACNHRKADRLLREIGWTLPFSPRPPSGATAMIFGHDRRDPVWAQYLTAWQSPAEVAS